MSQNTSPGDVLDALRQRIIQAQNQGVQNQAQGRNWGQDRDQYNYGGHHGGHRAGSRAGNRAGHRGGHRGGGQGGHNGQRRQSASSRGRGKVQQGRGRDRPYNPMREPTKPWTQSQNSQPYSGQPEVKMEPVSPVPALSDGPSLDGSLNSYSTYPERQQSSIGELSSRMNVSSQPSSKNHRRVKKMKTRMANRARTEKEDVKKLIQESEERVMNQVQTMLGQSEMDVEPQAFEPQAFEPQATEPQTAEFQEIIEPDGRGLESSMYHKINTEADPSPSNVRPQEFTTPTAPLANCNNPSSKLIQVVWETSTKPGAAFDEVHSDGDEGHTGEGEVEPDTMPLLRLEQITLYPKALGKHRRG